MKKENGITLIALIITVIITILLTAIAVNYGFETLDTVKLQNFNYELQQIQGKVDTIYEKIKLGQTEYITLGENITESEEAMQTLNTVKNIDYSSVSGDDYYINEDTLYRYFSESDLKEEFNISSNPGDMIINFKTREVISVKGFKFDDRLYYTLNDVGSVYVLNKEDYEYASNGLILRYDAINNTGNGHSNTTIIWKDLSGNNNDGTIHGVNGTAESGWYNNYIALDGIDDYVEKQGITIDGANGTIEIVAEYIEGTYLLRSNASGQSVQRTYILPGGTMKGDPGISTAYANYNSSLRYILQTRTLKWYTDNNTSYTVNYWNMNKSGADQFEGTNNGTYISIGSYYATRAEQLAKMKVYAVRVYNRALTDEEIAKNYKIDKMRFGI